MTQAPSRPAPATRLSRDYWRLWWANAVSATGDGAFAAADAKTGKPLWSFQTNETPHASPMTYMFDNKQYVAVAMGPNVISFGLPD